MTTPHSIDPQAFRTFEHAGWQGVAAPYHGWFAALTSQAIDPLLAAVRVGPGGRLLDIATGPGYVATAAAQRSIRVIAVDFSGAMVRLARAVHPGLDCPVADAASLPFRADVFDGAAMNFGMLHLATPEQAVREAYRVLRPGGRFAFTVWAPPHEAIAFGIVLQAIGTHGNMDIALPPGPPFFRFSDPEECERVLLDAGFVEPMVKRIPQTWRLPSPDALFEAMREGTVRTAGLLRAQTAEALAAIRDAIRTAAEPFRKEDGVALPMPAVLASALKP